MSTFDAFGYRDKRVLVVGGASGMGAATVEVARDAGAEVVAMDFAPITAAGVRPISLNLADTDSIDAALDELGGPVDVVFAAAGVADGTPGIEKINFLGHRYLIERMLDRGWLGRGGAIGFISSAAGLGWQASLELLHEYLDIADVDAASAWAHAHGKADYFWSKQAVCAYVAREAMPLLARGIRINAICPGPTDTPLARANADTWLGFGADYRSEVGVEASTALEQAYPLVFLCSDAASAITGTTVVSDAGFFAAAVTERFPSATPIANFLLGKY
jgi:NAD(P)-dependent dehydrogenase (short-subunit alcohol dehydrogenase family)